ncbi:MAG: hypothetical protein IKJ05_04955, partial [Oscillospiraceae bacterium]|nr:hypothetical protein [Oscillospiraceae bacterium]
MWQKDFSEISNNTELNENYMNIIKNYKRNKDNNVYLYFQIMFMSIIVIVSFVLKTGEGYIYEYTKDSYNKIFEIESYAESSFSYNSFIEKMKNDLQLRYSQLMEVYNNISGQGSANIYPENVSTKKYVPATKGVVPAYGYISSPYGFRTDPFNKKKKEFHTGIDIAA